MGSNQAGRRGRLTPLLSAGLAGVLVVAVVALAYGSAAPQLGVAEFAPAAQQQVTAPPTTSASAGAAASAAARRTTTTVSPTTVAASDGSPATSAAPTTRPPRGRACVGSPPRQTEDPMSPPCVAAIFEGDNGGETTRGVTGTEIRVAVPLRTSESAATKAIFDALFQYMNSRYEFYGRRLVPVYVATAGSNAALDGSAQPQALRALAAEIGAQGPFAMLPTQLETGNPHPAFFSEMARQGVVTVTRGAGQYLPDRTTFDPLHPFLWSVYPSLEQLWTNTGSFICAALGGGEPARWAGDPAMRGVERKFGILSIGAYGAPDTSQLVALLESCGITPVVAGAFDRGSASSSDTRVAVTKLKDQGVTTVICACNNYFSWFWSLETSLGYRPEWLFPSMGGQGASGSGDETFVANWLSAVPALTSPFGLSEHPKLLPIQAMSWFSAYRSMVPNGDAKAAASLGPRIYDELALLAAGIQGAGPALTPDRFAQALMSMQFPNPDAGAAPFWQPSVGFGPGDHSFYNDYALVSWNRTMSSLDAGNTYGGAWCYLDQGARFGAGRFPSDADARFFPNDASSCR